MRRWIQNISLAVFSLLSVYALTEFVVFPRLIPLIPLKHHEFLDKCIRPLAQTSKKGTLPEDYTLVLGDSYASGSGYWLARQTDTGKNPPFQALHLAHQRTGKNIINFGFPGAGSLRSFVRQTLIHRNFFKDTWLYKLAHPRTLILYYYEGNDIDNNLAAFEYYYSRLKNKEDDVAGLQDALALRNQNDIERIISHMFKKENSLVTEDHIFLNKHPVLGNLFCLKFIARILTFETERVIYRFKRGKWPVPKPAFVPDTNKYGTDLNYLRVGEKTIPAPALHDAGTDLDAKRTFISLRVFEHCLKFITRFYKDIPVKLVYIPSAASIYEHAGEFVFVETSYGTHPVVFFETGVIRPRSDAIVKNIREITLRHGIEFVDASPALRDAARNEVIHGPIDWIHLNRRGYEVLAGVIVSALEPPASKVSDDRQMQLILQQAIQQMPRPTPDMAVPPPAKVPLHGLDSN